MRAMQVDERDSSWERHDARFRVYVFEGGSSVTTTDILDASVEEALEAAHMLSRGDEEVWALALVHDEHENGRGLVWLSGMDYTDVPEGYRDALYWRRRKQMQNRYLAARNRRGLSLTMPDGRRIIRMFPEWISGWPLWESFSDDYRLTAESLGLSASLSADLFSWNERWLSRSEEDPEPDGWRQDGLSLHARLQDELRDVAEVRPEFLRD